MTSPFKKNFKRALICFMPVLFASKLNKITPDFGTVFFIPVRSLQAKSAKIKRPRQQKGAINVPNTLLIVA